MVRNLTGNSGDAGNPGSIPGSGRSPGGGNSNPFLLPGKSHGLRNLVGYSSWGHRVRYDLATKHEHKP